MNKSFLILPILVIIPLLSRVQERIPLVKRLVCSSGIGSITSQPPVTLILQSIKPSWDNFKRSAPMMMAIFPTESPSTKAA